MNNNANKPKLSSFEKLDLTKTEMLAKGFSQVLTGGKVTLINIDRSTNNCNGGNCAAGCGTSV
jgi:hypothetical protein